MKIDAEYMNRWLGESTQIESLSPKILYDIKTLIEYYRDIIVPGSDVSISFPVEGRNSSPRASVERGEVNIPYYMLKDGEVDNTIGAMVHELHHIKLSASERFLSAITFKFLRHIMEQIDCGSMTMADRLFADASITADKIMGWTYDPISGTSDIVFLREAIGDLMFIINAVEDVRIDANTPPNLKKYIDKLEKQASVRILDAIDKGDLGNESRDLNAIAFMLLVHHKDIHKFPFIEDRFGDTDAIVNADALELPVSVFSAFKEEIASHLLQRYYHYCGKPKDSSSSEGSDEMDLDAYFGSKVKSAVGDSLEKQFDEKQNGKAHSKKKDEEDVALAGAGEKIKEVSVTTDIAPGEAHDASGTTQTDTKIDLSEKADTVRNWGDWRQDNDLDALAEIGRQLREEMEEDKKTVFLSSTVEQQINSFKDVQVITTTEHFGDDTSVVYDSVLYDTI